MKAPHLIDSSAIIDRAIKTPYHPKLLTLQNRGSLLSSLMNGLSYFCISYFSLQGLQCQERNLFLFNDLLLIAKERSSSHFKLKDQVRWQDNITVTIARMSERRNRNWERRVRSTWSNQLLLSFPLSMSCSMVTLLRARDRFVVQMRHHLFLLGQ